MKTPIVPFEATVRQALAILEGLASPRALSVYILAKEYLLNTYDAISFSLEIDRLELHVNNYDHRYPETFSIDYQATVLLSKLPPKSGTATLRDAALLGFKDSEERNAIINEKWSLDKDPYFSEAGRALLELGFDIEDLRSIIRRVLGRAPSLQSLDDSIRWSSGASVGLSRSWSSGECKAEMGVTVTYPLACALSKLDSLNPLISKDAWVLVPGNLVTTVPKNIKTDRTIAMEPDINAVYQRAIGSRIARRLACVGINLSSQANNQNACLRAQVDKLATIDIKNASNSVLRNVVFSLLPDDWCHIIDITRSAYGSLNSRSEWSKGKAEWFEYQMLSSMGNGYTFELESLLFFSICQWVGVPVYDIYVYGDDIIIPQTYVRKLVAVLSVFGFEVNLEKSFTSGTFFESCGVYAFNGVDVTPLKIKDLLNDDKDRIILANKLRMYAHLLNNRNGCSRRMLSAWRMCISGISKHVHKHCRGPVGSGILLYCNIDECTSKYSLKRGALVVQHLVPKKIASYEADWPSLLTFRLQPKRQSDNPFDSVTVIKYGNVVREDYRGYVSSHLHIEGPWYDLGRWS